MQNITVLLENIYSEVMSASQKVRLLNLIEEARTKVSHTRKTHWDESDVVLITYGDQFKKNDTPALSNLDAFYNRYLKNYFNTIHILPFYPWSSDDGFSVIDYHRISPDCGDWTHIEALKQSSNLMFDYVCNHISAKSEWFTGFLNKDAKYDDYFVAMDPNIDLSDVVRPRTSPLLTPFTCADGEVKHIWTTFSADQIDLNFANPEVLISMVDVLLHYLQEGADYVRLDAVGYMWKEPGTNCMHLEKTHQLVKLMRAIADEVAPGTVLITETNVPHKDNISYFGNGQDEAQMVYQFPLPPLVLHAVHAGNANALSQWAHSLGNRDGHTTYFNFLASHDGIGMNPLRGLIPEQEILAMIAGLEKEGALVSYKNNADGSVSPYEINVTYMDALNKKNDDDSLRLQRFMLAHSILLAFPGVPAVYIQSILGSRNDYVGVETAGYNRAINRHKFMLDEVMTELEQEDALRAKVYTQLGELIKLRRTRPEFHPDSRMDVEFIGEGVFCFSRVTENNEKIICLFNVTNEEQLVKAFNGQCYTDLITQNEVADNIRLQPYQYMWLY